jgi:hypothetical protein
VKIRWSSLFFGSFAPHFQIKLSIHASNFNSRFVSMSELELFLLTAHQPLGSFSHMAACRSSLENT